MAILIDGKAHAARHKAEIASATEGLKARGITPALAVIIVGGDPASRVYVDNKKRDCAETGIRSLEFALPGDAPQDELVALIEKLNADPEVDGILCQLPLPRHIDEGAVIDAIAPEKDVDAFHERSVGRIMLGRGGFLPCTPAGVMALLEGEGIDPSGKDCVVVGRSNIVGKPMAMLLLQKNATVTVCHSRTAGLAGHTKRADIVIMAVGRAGLLTGDMIKPGAVVIDVGVNRLPEGGLAGDVDFASVEPVAGYITPVPGGVGPMTRVMLLRNTLTAAGGRRGV